MPKETTTLEREFRVYEKQRRQWVRDHLGEYVVIHGGEVAGFYPDYEAGLRAGLKQFGFDRQFLVKQVCLEEPVFVIY